MTPASQSRGAGILAFLRQKPRKDQLMSKIEEFLVAVGVVIVFFIVAWTVVIVPTMEAVGFTLPF